MSRAAALAPRSLVASASVRGNGLCTSPDPLALPLAGIPRNATGLVFGKAFQEAIGVWAYVIGTGIHFVFAAAWGILFAVIWPYFRRRGFEATFIALFYAMFAWIVMHVAIMIASTNHPNYYDPNVIIGGFMSHFCFTVPLALVVKRMLGGTR